MDISFRVLCVAILLLSLAACKPQTCTVNIVNGVCCTEICGESCEPTLTEACGCLCNDTDVTSSSLDTVFGSQPGINPPPLPN